VESSHRRCLHRAFEEIALRFPLHTAACEPGGPSLTYAELNARANRWACRLRSQGVGPGRKVAVLSEKNLDLLTALLAILKSGAAYVPLDPAYPPERLGEMLDDAAPALLLTQQAFRERWGEGATRAEFLDSPEWAHARETESGENLNEAHDPDSLAYVIYTSGSTGRSKGTLTTHHNVLRLLEQAREIFAFGPHDVWTLFHSYSFDFSVWEIWGALFFGGRLVIVPHSVSRSSADFHAVLRQEKVTVLNCTPSAFQPLLRRQLRADAEKLALRYLILGGETLDFASLRPWFARYGSGSPRVVNGYGPTETTIFATFKFLTERDCEEPVVSNIGQGLPDLTLEILEGELVIAGPGVAAGYLNRPELTAEKFIPRPAGRAYRSGDRVRRLPSGDLEYLGRLDDQVKLRGYRIELGEIEAVLARQAEVAQAGVCLRGSGAATRLEAYVVLRPDADPSPELLRSLQERLRRGLPNYMVPARLAVIDELPLTPHGKRDRAALARLTPISGPEARSPIDGPEAPLVPRRELESTLEALWRELLGRDRVGRDENFFDAGGSSLLGELLLERIEERCGRSVSMDALFAHPTISSLVDLLAPRAPSTAPRNAAGSAAESARDAPIAVIGLEGRFPGARDIEEFWELLRAGRETLRSFSPEEIDPTEDVANPHYVRVRGVIEGAADFDAAFFGFTKLEASVLDPQQRLFLELCWRTLEKAGYATPRPSVRIGVFGGVSANTYFHRHVLASPEVMEKVGLLGAQILNEKDYVASRVAYKLDLKGPTLSIHSACSTSLVAIAEAVFALREGRCEMALAGGASIRSPENAGHVHQADAMLSRDGHTRSFSADASGTVFSDGGGAVLLKRLEDALRDGDEVYAVIRGAAVNNDGALKASFSAPSIPGQVEVLRAALTAAGLRARDLSYIEGHGTATPLGDPFELEALRQAFREDTPDVGFCALGSVKSNFGHLVAAAGVASFIKTVLALHKGELPPTLGADQPTPRHDWPHSPFRLNTSLRAWTGLRRAGISSFGVGGTNAHVVLESAPSPLARPALPPQPQLLVLSARDSDALSLLSQSWASALEDSAALADAAFTSVRGRSRYPYRRWIVAVSPQEARQKLSAPEWSEAADARPALSHLDVGFLFPGHGSQYAGMGEALLQHDDLFARFWEECESVAGRLRRQGPLSQRSLLAFEYCLARTWIERGLVPPCLVGYSLGELTAGALAGVLSLRDVFELGASLESFVGERCGRGGLLSVRLSKDELREKLPASLTIAAVNSPWLSVVAGPEAALRDFEGRLARDQVAAARIPAEYPYHSPAMAPAVGPLLEKIQSFRLSSPKLPIFSSATGRALSEDEARDPRHWAGILQAPVNFQEAFASAATSHPQTAWLEVGPGVQLSTFARQSNARPSDTPARTVVASLSAQLDHEQGAWLSAHGKLWALGASLDLPAPPGARHADFPIHPLRPERCWIEPSPAPPLARAPAVATLPPSLSDSVREVFEEISGMDLRQTAPDAKFLDLGMDSLFLTQASNALEKKFKVAVPFRRLLEDLSSLRRVSDFLGENRVMPASSLPAPAPPPLAAEPATAKTPFGAIARVSRRSEAFTPRQAESFDRWRREYEARTSASKKHAQANRAHFADPRVVSGFKPPIKEIVYPLVIERSRGSRLWDLDGHEYVDLLNGFGTNFLGHSPDFVVQAQKRQLELGIEVGPSTPLAGECARLFCEITGNERAAFCCTGSEAVLGCLRIARTVTGRDLVVVFSGSYHGIFDEVIVRKGKQGRAYSAAPGILPSNVGNVLVVDYGDPESLAQIAERASEIAAILVEPVQSRNPKLQPVDFLRELRRLTEARDICLIFDEVITGLRAHPGGAQTLFDVRADLASYGKVVGGGNPIGVIAGRARFMNALDGGAWQFGDASKPETGVTYFAGTYLRHPLALAAARAVLEHLQSSGPALQEHLNARTRAFVDNLNAHFRSVAAPLEIHFFASMFRLVFTRDLPYAELLCLRMRTRGVHIVENFPCFLSTAHTDEDLDLLARVFRESVSDMQAAGFFPEAGARPLTPAQREIWTACQLGTEASLAYNEAITWRIPGSWREEPLRQALRWLTERHESLRSSFSAQGEARVETAPPEIAFHRESLRTGDLDLRLAREVSTPFDLARAPLLRVALLDVGDDEARERIFLLSAHHLICDGWSFGVLLRELSLAYEAFAQHQVPELPPAPQMPAFAALRTERAPRNRAFWREVFRDPPERLDLPHDRERPARRGFAAQRLDHVLSPRLVAAIRSLGQKQGASFFATLLTGLSGWLHRVSGQGDQVIAIALAGQASCQMPGLVGHGVNTLPLRLRSRLDHSVQQSLQSQRGAILDALEHGDFTLGEVLEGLALPRGDAHPPLTPLLFNLDQALDASVASVPRAFENFELFLNAVERPDGSLVVETQYSSELFSRGQIRALLTSWESFWASAVQTPERPLRELNLLSETELKTLRAAADDVVAGEAPVPVWMASLHPNAEVSDLSGRQLKAATLERAAVQVERGLRRRGLQSGDRVGVMLERTAFLPAALLGIGACETAYVPLDPTHPAARLRETVEDAEVHSVLADRLFEQAALALGRPVIWLEDLLQGETHTGPLTIPSPSAAAYVLYTSGSTGKPKGVVVSHGSVGNLLRSMRDRPGLAPGQKIAAITTLGFDIAGLELYLPLLTGSRLVVIDRETARDGPRLLAALRAQRVDVLQATPTTWRLLLLAGLRNSGLRLKALCGGEVLPLDLAADLLACGCELWNMYGPTETTIWSSCHRVLPEDLRTGFVPLGDPVANTFFCLLDEASQPVPDGITGEICIGGQGLALGYWRNAELTREKFVEHEFGRLYRSGDLGRRSVAAALQILGRRDLQVKVRGHRIEMGEVEGALARHPEVRQSAVVTRRNGPDAELVAFYVSNRALPPNELRRFLALSLPEGSLPTRYLHVESLPLTFNDKIDRVRLAAQATSPMDPRGILAPRPLQDDERALAEHWAALLGRKVESLSPDSDFFSEGGHSVLAMRLVHRVTDEGRALSLKDVFEAPRLADLAARVRQASPPARSLVVPPRVRERAPLSLMQERLYYLERLFPQSRAQNLPAAFVLKGALDRAALQRAFTALGARQTALSLVISEDEHGPWLDTREWPTLLVYEAIAPGKLAARLREEARRPFDLARGPLFRARVFELARDTHVLCVVAHHLVFDGWSFDVFLEELSGLYAPGSDRAPSGDARVPLPFDYRDFAEQQRHGLDTLVDQHAEFWRHELADLPALELPFDRPRPARPQHLGEMMEFSVDEALVRKLVAVAQAQGATLSMLLLSAFLVELRRWSGQEDFGVGVPVQGRPSPQLEKLIGYFVNTIVLRSHAPGATTFLDYLGAVRARCIKAFEHQDMPFEKIMESRKRAPGGQRPPLYQAFFSYQDTRNREPRLGSLELSQIHVHAGYVSTDLTLWVKETGRGLLAGIDYSSELFETSTVRDFIARFQSRLRRIADGKNDPLNEAPVPDDAADSPQTPTEKALATLWVALLEPSMPPRRSDYFFDVGGHSLLALRLLSAVEQRFAVRLDAQHLLTRNLGQLAALCEHGPRHGWRAMFRRWRSRG